MPEENAVIACNEQFQSALEAAVDEIRREALLVLKKTSAGLDTDKLRRAVFNIAANARDAMKGAGR